MVFIYVSIIHECADDSNTICDYFCKFSLDSDPIRDNIINVYLPFRFCHAEELPVAFPQVEEKTERRQPDLLGRKMQLRRSVIEKPGEQFLVC